MSQYKRAKLIHAITHQVLGHQNHLPATNIALGGQHYKPSYRS